MMTMMRGRAATVAAALLMVVNWGTWTFCFGLGDRLLVNMTLVRNATALGAFCLDGSLPAYHLHRGFGAGSRNWLLQFEWRQSESDRGILGLGFPRGLFRMKCGFQTSDLDKNAVLKYISPAAKYGLDAGGGWCNDIESCRERAQTRRGSTRYMSKLETFSGILSNNASLNPDFYNWNRVKLRYCDGGSFIGDAKFDNGVTKLWSLCAKFFSELIYNVVLYFRGQKIWQAIILDLLPKGLRQARKALLSGCSAGGLSSFLHCDNFARMLPKNASVKCLSDAGFFMDERDISLNRTMRSFFENLVSLQCIFPQYVLKYITTPFFILNTAYDVYQVNIS
ncbi:hypothetical protein Tsubulata_049965 [Turnera subulata]|uniref:Pectin acetylesterase n=1 Tax=Turnera subulata TaxID=218843 RepID=A0A9Q0JA12_9ROSI|nr:hypothetical protein Tsubulata_049965 [Turnera subulata]